MPSLALLDWQNDRMPRLSQVEAHCMAVAASLPANSTFLDECLRGHVLHLSAHFQGFCRDLYTECSQVRIAGIPADFQATAQAQFKAQLSLGKSNPTYNNIKQDFSRFGFLLDVQAAHALGARWITDLGHLNEWRNKAAHQGTQPLPGGILVSLTSAVIQGWLTSCDGLANSLDAIMYREMLRIIGVALGNSIRKGI